MAKLGDLITTDMYNKLTGVKPTTPDESMKWVDNHVGKINAMIAAQTKRSILLRFRSVDNLAMKQSKLAPEDVVFLSAIFIKINGYLVRLPVSKGCIDTSNVNGQMLSRGNIKVVDYEDQYGSRTKHLHEAASVIVFLPEVKYKFDIKDGELFLDHNRAKELMAATV